MIKRIDNSADDFRKKTLNGWIVDKWVVKRIHLQDVGPIEVVVLAKLQCQKTKRVAQQHLEKTRSTAAPNTTDY